jgi:hypothetical protein
MKINRPQLLRPFSGTRARVWCVGSLAAATLLGGAVLAFGPVTEASAPHKAKDQVGEVGFFPFPFQGQGVSGPTSFRVSSFNVLGYDHTEKGGQKHGYADGATRMKWAVQLLKSHQVSVVGFQELQPPQLDKFVKKASNQYDIFPGSTETDGFMRNSIAWRKDTWRLLSTSWVKLPYFHGEILRMPVVLLQNIGTGQQVYFMNFQNPSDTRGNAAKWRFEGQTYQMAYADSLRDTTGLPVVWTGDMNAKAQVFCRVTRVTGMITAAGGVRTPTSCQPPPDMVVDWIFGSRVTFSDYVADRSPKVVRTTDHHMLVTDVTTQATLPLPTATPPPVTATPTPTGNLEWSVSRYPPKEQHHGSALRDRRPH